ncbi:MAG: FGGY-family carbohydrate kinase, partial [Chloroflexota bacterium]
MMGVMLSAAGSLRWYHDMIAPASSYDELLEPAARIAPGSDGLYFLPYLTGERTPHPDPLARGAFIGLTVRHEQAHLSRSVLEGVAYGLRDSFELMKMAGLRKIEQVRVSGGGTNSQLWLQILADVLQSELVSINTTEGAAYGAAILAAVGANAFSDVPTACEALIQVTKRTPPSDAMASYDEHYALYQSLYPALQSTFKAIPG